MHKRVVVVEDNKGLREQLVQILCTTDDIRCVGAFTTAEEALKKIPGLKPDVVLMDIKLPGMSGIDCVAELKRTMPALQIIMVTVYEDTERIFRALRAGACGYLLKRCTPEELISAIREVRQGGAPMSRDIARKVIASFQEPLKTTAEMEELSPREREILELLAQGLPNKEIARRMGVNDGTVRWHLRHVYDKLHVRSRTEAALKFRSAKAE